MELPTRYNNFRESVLNRLEALCRCRLLGALDNTKITAWLNNFRSHEHQYLALHILDSLIYRTNGMMVNAYRRFLASEARNIVASYVNRPVGDVDQWMSNLAHRNSQCQWRRYFKIVGAYDGNEQAQSGSNILRALNADTVNQYYNFNQSGAAAEALRQRVILVVDDMVGSGRQYQRVYEEMRLDRLAEENKVIFSPLFGFADGIERARAVDRRITILPLEVLTDAHSFFHGADNDNFRRDDVNTVGEAKECYREMCDLAGVRDCTRHGWNGLELTVAYDWGCPNHTLGLLWDYGSSRDWQRLFERRAG